LNFLGRVYKEIPRRTTSQNSSGGGGGVVPCARTDRQTDVTKIIDFSHFCERALQPFLEVYHQADFLASEGQLSILSPS